MSHAQTVFANVAILSDEEGGGDLVTPVRLPSKRPTVSTEKTVQKAGAVRLFGCSSSKGKISPQLGEHGLQKKDMVARTRAIVQSKCRCSRGKFKREIVSYHFENLLDSRCSLTTCGSWLVWTSLRSTKRCPMLSVYNIIQLSVYICMCSHFVASHEALVLQLSLCLSGMVLPSNSL